jgi:hypothetical protein
MQQSNIIHAWALNLSFRIALQCLASKQETSAFLVLRALER